MSTPEADTPLASFAAKWSAARPEFGLALRFVDPRERVEQSAFACLVFELEHAAFGIREAQPATIKLQWWAEEFARTTRNEARHPLTRALGGRLARSGIETARWHAVIIGALAQRDPEPAADAIALLQNHAQFYAPLGGIEATLFGVDASAIGKALALMRALRDMASLSDVLRDGKLPLPLDLLARHRLARGDLAAATPTRDAALREWLGWIAAELDALAGRESIQARPLGVLRAAMAAADATRASRIARGQATEPLAAINAALAGLSLPVLWSAWRTARRSRP